VEDITANGQVTVIEIVVTGPSLGAELLATDDQGVEHAETEEQGLVLRELVALGTFELALVELAECTTQVGLEILRSLISNLNGVLHDRLRDNFHFG